MMLIFEFILVSDQKSYYNMPFLIIILEVIGQITVIWSWKEGKKGEGKKREKTLKEAGKQKSCGKS